MDTNTSAFIRACMCARDMHMMCLGCVCMACVPQIFYLENELLDVRVAVYVAVLAHNVLQGRRNEMWKNCMMRCGV